MKKILFICNQNQHRSPTAEKVFKSKFETLSAGLYNGTPVSQQQLDWADLIIVMEDEMTIELKKRFPNLKKKIISLGIPDIYFRDQPELIELLEEKMQHHLKG